MDIAALVPLSLSDHEGRVAAVVFVRGCNFRCPFCHNPELVLPGQASGAALGAGDVLRQLAERRGFLDSVVVTGGEPTLERDLSLFLSEVRALGFAIKLDTNGSRPEVLDALLERGLVDALAMDLKAPRPRYAEYSGVSVDLDAIERSICCIRESALEYEFRTTVAPGLGVPDLEAMAEWIRGARRYVLQPFRVPAEKGLVDPSWAERDSLSSATLREAWTKIAPLVRGGGVREVLPEALALLAFSACCHAFAILRYRRRA